MFNLKKELSYLPHTLLTGADWDVIGPASVYIAVCLPVTMKANYPSVQQAEVYCKTL
jgi:hypothetical protein